MPAEEADKVGEPAALLAARWTDASAVDSTDVRALSAAASDSTARSRRASSAIDARHTRARAAIAASEVGNIICLMFAVVSADAGVDASDRVLLHPLTQANYARVGLFPS